MQSTRDLFSRIRKWLGGRLGRGSTSTQSAHLEADEQRDVRRDRNERTSLLFGSWPSLTEVELRELEILSEERQRRSRQVAALEVSPRFAGRGHPRRKPRS